MRKLNTGNFIKRAREIHGYKYNYDLVVYVGYESKICIICNEHGWFWQTPGNHLHGQGCPKCAVNKRKKDPLFQEKAVFTAMIASRIADHFNVPYVVENPVSVLSTFWRKPDYIFNPWEYGGYLPENDIHPFFPEYINPRDSYPKKTCFWTGNGFIMPEKKIIPVKKGYSNQYHKLGGKSAKTKVIRSLTPRGIARAVFEANHDPS